MAFSLSEVGPGHSVYRQGRPGCPAPRGAVSLAVWCWSGSVNIPKNDTRGWGGKFLIVDFLWIDRNSNLFYWQLHTRSIFLMRWC